MVIETCGSADTPIYNTGVCLVKETHYNNNTRRRATFRDLHRHVEYSSGAEDNDGIISYGARGVAAENARVAAYESRVLYNNS